MSVVHRRAQLPLLAAAVAVVAWGFGPLFVRAIDADAATIVMWRMLIGAPIAVGVAYAAGGRITWGLLRRAWPTALCFALSIMTGFASMLETSIANATLIPALQPALVLFVAARMFGERRSRAEVGWAVVAFAGVTAVVLSADTTNASLFGDLLAVVNLVLFTGYFLFAKQARTGDVHSWSFFAAVTVIAAVVVTPWALVHNGGVEYLHGVDWLTVVALALIPGMVGHGFMTWAHRFVDVSITSMLVLANPVISIVGAWIVFDEALTPVQLVGAAVVMVALGSIVGHQRGARRFASEAALARDLLDAPVPMRAPADDGAQEAPWSHASSVRVMGAPPGGDSVEKKPFGHGVNQRELIKMTPEEIEGFLAEPHTLNVATINHDGTIHLVAMWYGMFEGCITFETKAKSQKIANLRRNPQITCLVEDGAAYEELRGVEVVGTAEIVDDPERLWVLGVSVFERHSGVAYAPEHEPQVRAMLHKRVGVKVHAQRYVSWDHRKLALAPTQSTTR